MDGGIELVPENTWQPFIAYGLTHSFFTINITTVAYTWISMVLLSVTAYAARKALKYPNSISGYCVRSTLDAFVQLTEQVFEGYYFNYCAFMLCLFFFIFFNNALVLIPTLEEPTKDINTTFALGLIIFFYIQREAIKAHGISHYLQDFFKMPLQVIPDKWTPVTFMKAIGSALVNAIAATLSFPLELMSKVSSIIIAMSLRLFGNIFGGSIIGSLLQKAISGSILFQFAAIGLNLTVMFFFGLFESFIQAFVFTVLSLTYLGMAIKSE